MYRSTYLIIVVLSLVVLCVLNANCILCDVTVNGRRDIENLQT